MLTAIILYLALTVYVCNAGAAPHVPNPPESFHAEGFLFMKYNGTHELFGPGHWKVDQPGQKAEESFDLNKMKVFALERFDEGEVFEITNNGACHKRQVPKNSFKPVWEWLKHAHYEGQVKRKGFDVEWWTLKVGQVEVGAGFDVKDPNRLRISFAKDVTGERVTVFHQFMARHSWNPEEFKVPHECTQ